MGVFKVMRLIAKTIEILKLKIIQYLLYFGISCFLVFNILNDLYPIQANIDYATIVTDTNGKILYSFLAKDEKWRMYTELDEISDELKKAIIYKEDKYFYYHFGINPIAIGRALINNILQNKRTSGASTITMQVVRLLEKRERTYFNKFIEMFRAIQLEVQFSKEEILQLYLNLVPYGGNIEGVKAASILYFEKQPNHLSLAEITALSIIPNRPSSLVIGQNNELILVERNKWLQRFKEDKVFSAIIIEDALSEPLTAYRHESPKHAPHFSFWLHNIANNKAIIKSTLDFEMQSACQFQVDHYMKTLMAYQIQNAAVLVVDNKTHQVKVYIGSADFYNNDDAGQVNGIKAIRQPGSTLKPLVYGLAFDKGHLTPKTMMTDVPINFNGYSPVNFNQEYNGYITVENALAQSLNVPAVKALNMVGVNEAIEKLVACEFSTIEKMQNQLGLSLVLGGCGVSLEELTGMYCAIQHNGQYSPLQYTFPQEKSDSITILSNESAYMVTEIMTQLERPDLPMVWQNTKDLPQIAWKTGTSYGRKDAWSIGFNDKYTVGVWVGNFSGEGVPELTGANIATPLLFSIFKAIDINPSKQWLSAPKELDFRFVCNQSGLLPSDSCQHTNLDYFLPGISSNQQCQHVKKYFISENDSFSYCMQCLPEAGYKEVWYDNHPIEMLAYFKSHLITHYEIPIHNPACENIRTQLAPQIVTPINGSTYLLIEDELEPLVLRCNTSDDIQQVVWYVNDKVFQIANKDEAILFFPEKAGHFKISCSDDQGGNANIYIDIEFI